MTTTTKISKQQAEAALAAVRAQWKTYLEPITLPEYTDENGQHFASFTLGPTYPEPTLVEDWDDDGWAIVWEDGPDEWAYRVNSGEASEEERILVAQAAEEFGLTVAEPTGPGPAPGWPAEVFGEPYYSFVLSLYPS